MTQSSSDQDGAEPSPNSVAASNLHRLSTFLGKPLQPCSADVYKTFSEMMSKHPVALPEMVSAFILHNQTPKQAGSREPITRPKSLFCRWCHFNISCSIFSNACWNHTLQITFPLPHLSNLRMTNERTEMLHHMTLVQVISVKIRMWTTNPKNTVKGCARKSQHSISLSESWGYWI